MNEEVIMVSKSLTKTKGLISFFIPVATAGGGGKFRSLYILFRLFIYKGWWVDNFKYMQQIVKRENNTHAISMPSNNNNNNNNTTTGKGQKSLNLFVH